MNICMLPHGRPQGLLFLAVVNICKRVPKVGRWPNGGMPRQLYTCPPPVPNDWAGVDTPAPLRCAHHTASTGPSASTAGTDIAVPYGISLIRNFTADRRLRSCSMSLLCNASTSKKKKKKPETFRNQMGVFILFTQVQR